MIVLVGTLHSGRCYMIPCEIWRKSLTQFVIATLEIGTASECQNLIPLNLVKFAPARNERKGSDANEKKKKGY